MLVNEYKPEFYDRKVRKMRNLGNVYICGSSFVMSRTDAQNGLYSNFIISRICDIKNCMYLLVIYVLLLIPPFSSTSEKSQRIIKSTKEELKREHKLSTYQVIFLIHLVTYF